MFELLFLLLVFVSIVAVVSAIGAAFAGRRLGAVRIARTLLIGWSAYVAMVIAVAAIQSRRPQRVLEMGQERCFDEMCFSVAGVQSAEAIADVKASGRFYVVTVQAASHSRGRIQREGGLRALVWDSGKYYAISKAGQRAYEAQHGDTAPLDSRLAPGESIRSVQVFDVPITAREPALVLSHGFTPGYFVIGECPLFQKPTVIRLGR